jgi:hypothetical protein
MIGFAILMKVWSGRNKQILIYLIYTLGKGHCRMVSDGDGMWGNFSGNFVMQKEISLPYRSGFLPFMLCRKHRIE